MLNLSDYRVVSNDQVRKLRGGNKHNCELFVAILDQNTKTQIITVRRYRFLSQMGSQRSEQFPGGYLLFATPQGERRYYCLRTQNLGVSQLREHRNRTFLELLVPRPAVILENPPLGSAAYRALWREHDRATSQEVIRSCARRDFHMVLEILTNAPAGFYRQHKPEWLVECFEQPLRLESDERLKDLAALLSMPEPPLQFARAA